jgi:uncharacterized oxidoreductase
LTQNGTPSEAIINSMLSVILWPAAVGGAAYPQQREALVTWMRVEPKDAGHVLLPGEPEGRRRERLLADGITLDPVTWADMVEAAASVGIADLAACASAG